ncbi:uncharacterized protein N0V89_002337 [Didymosphaeria variabile]|uniref:Major facilitator superfamily (MFS) profile domain-containing protein n=1 Tax=Didymosphaeria variabile TaxID=1932322 RepID=A0A9W8XSB3_9PLEO|nr:uncharacterized protein N0V89_002337 [Didymosphaeria variabile]KAJ4357761.1 hypothetical protein N0V89_002337 [Didymosphaeria variabile]
MFMGDKFGRRNTLMFFYAFQCLWMFLLAGLGAKANKTATESNMVVSSFMLYGVFYNIGGASIPYLLGTELPNAALREKTQAFGTSWNVLWAFVTNFSIPYIIIDMHFSVGWVFDSVFAVALVYMFIFLPETKGLALERIDAVFRTPSIIFVQGRSRKLAPSETLAF